MDLLLAHHHLMVGFSDHSHPWSVRPSVRSVRPSVRPSFRPSVNNFRQCSESYGPSVRLVVHLTFFLWTVRKQFLVIANAQKLWFGPDSYFTNWFPIRSSCAPDLFFRGCEYSKWLPSSHLENVDQCLLSPFHTKALHINILTFYITLAGSLVVHLTIFSQI